MSNRLYTSIGIGLFFVAIILSIAYLPQFALIIFVSLILHSLLVDLVDSMSAGRMPRALAALSVLGCFVLLLAVVFTIVSATIVPMGQDFINRLPQMVKTFMALPWVKDSPIIGRELNLVWTQLTNFSVGFMSSSLTVVVSVFTRVIDILLTLLVTYYFLADGDRIQRWLITRFSDDQQKRISELMEGILGSLRVFIVSQLKICILMGLLVYSYFAYRSLPYGPVFAIFSGVAEFLPVVGPTIASCFASLIMVTISPVIGLQTMFFFLIITQINHNLIYPAFVGHSLRLHPLAIILGLTLAGELIGPIGMFMAVPTMVIGRMIVEDIHRVIVENRKNE